MSTMLLLILPEIILTALAGALFLFGCSRNVVVRKATPILALAGLLACLAIGAARWTAPEEAPVPVARLCADDPAVSHQVFADRNAPFFRLLIPAVGIILVLMAWPSLSDGTGNSSLRFGNDAGEFFALFLLSIAGLLLTTVANDIITLFLALELVSIPTYIMVALSRHRAVAQEAAVKYFFLGAMSAALMLFGFSYLYGVTGHINLARIGEVLRSSIAAGGLTPWQKLALLLVILGFAFKLAAFPLHFYAGDVYEGAATPVTAFLAFVPKAAGVAAMLKLLAIVGGPNWKLPPDLVTLLAVLAAITMTVGNVLGLLQQNVKRVLAYSSVAHSGYMLVGMTALASTGDLALHGVLFYLAAYGIMNVGAFGTLMMLPSRDKPDESAETFDDLTGAGRQHLIAGLAMAVACFALTGIPLTIGFMGKLLLFLPALKGGLIWLALLLAVNAAISAAYYLKIIATLFLKPAPTDVESVSPQGWAVRTAVALSVVGTLLFGTLPPAADSLLRGAGASDPNSLKGAKISQIDPK